MARVVKLVQTKDGGSIEVYSDTCIKCQKEMIFPKDKADEIESLIPFMKEKIEKGTPCADCMKEEMKNGTSLFSDKEIEVLKMIAREQKKKVMQKP